MAEHRVMKFGCGYYTSYPCTCSLTYDHRELIDESCCGTCRFFIPDNDMGHCRRHAPTMEGYPGVYSSDWCGDYDMGTNPSQESVKV